MMNEQNGGLANQRVIDAEWSKRCPCGIVYTRAEWNKLMCIGFQLVPADETSPSEAQELRHCNGCCSTMNVDADLQTIVRVVEENTPRVGVYSDASYTNDWLRVYTTAARAAVVILTEQLEAASRRARLAEDELARKMKENPIDLMGKQWSEP